MHIFSWFYTVMYILQKQGWNTYTLLFDGENVLAMIEDPNALGKADSSSTRLKGRNFHTLNLKMS